MKKATMASLLLLLSSPVLGDLDQDSFARFEKIAFECGLRSTQGEALSMHIPESEFLAWMQTRGASESQLAALANQFRNGRIDKKSREIAWLSKSKCDDNQNKGSVSLCNQVRDILENSKKLCSGKK